MAVHLLLGPGVGAVGEGVGEVVVEGTKAVEEEQVVGVEERDACCEITFDTARLWQRERERERSEPAARERLT